jgi:hypothetical protein
VSSPLSRRGSVPMAVGVVTCLGLIGGASIFMTSSQARLDKQTEAHQLAGSIAQAAIEEALVKISNNQAYFTAHQRNRVVPAVTQALFTQTRAQIADVEIMSRPVTTPKNSKQLVKFLGVLRALPGFYYPENPPAGAPERHSTAWREDFSKKFEDAANPGARAFIEAVRLPPVDLDGQVVEVDPETAEHYHKTITAESGTGQDGGDIYKAFRALPVLSSAGADPFQLDPNGQGYLLHTSELPAFKAAWNTCMEAVLARVNKRIGNCGGNPNYGVGAELGAFAAGKAVNADGVAEEEIRESAQASGVLKYMASLVTLSTQVSVDMGGIKTCQPVTAQRIVQEVHLWLATTYLRRQLAGYLIHYYGLTLADLTVSEAAGGLGWIGWNPAAGPLTRIQDVPAMLGPLNEGFPDDPSPKVWPFQLATCHARPR